MGDAINVCRLQYRMQSVWGAWRVQVKVAKERSHAAKLLLSRILQRHLWAGWHALIENQQIHRKLRWALHQCRHRLLASAWRRWRSVLDEGRAWQSAVAHFDSTYAPSASDNAAAGLLAHPPAEHSPSLQCFVDYPRRRGSGWKGAKFVVPRSHEAPWTYSL